MRYCQDNNCSHATAQQWRNKNVHALLRYCVTPRSRGRAVVLGIFVLVLCVGCGSSRVPVNGNVTFDGKPVEEGMISFEPTDGQGPATGGKIIGGRYELVGDAAPLPGKKTVRIFAARKTGRQVVVPMPVPRPGPPQMADEIETYIPDVYNTQSNLTCEVSPGESRQIDFHLKAE